MPLTRFDDLGVLTISIGAPGMRIELSNGSQNQAERRKARAKLTNKMRCRDAPRFSNQIATMSRISTRRPMMITVVEIVTFDWPPARTSFTARA